MHRKSARNYSGLIWPAAGFLSVLLLWSMIERSPSQPTAQVRPEDNTKQSLSSALLMPAWSSWGSIQNIFVFGESPTSTGFQQDSPQLAHGTTIGDWNLTTTEPVLASISWTHFLQADDAKISNFAQNGAFVDRHAYKAQPLTEAGGLTSQCVTLKEQVSCWNHKYALASWHDGKREWTAQNSMAMLWFGFTDVTFAKKHKNGVLATDAVFATYSSSLERLYYSGVRNFLIINVPSPQGGAGATAITAFNSRLRSMRDKVLRRHPDATLFLLDAHALYSKVMEAPTSFSQTTNLREVQKVCAANTKLKSPDSKDPGCDFARDQYLWLDDGLPGKAAQQLIASVLQKDCFGADGPSGYCQ